MNASPTTVDARTSPRRFAVMTDPRRRNARGSSGDLERASMATKAASTSAESPIGRYVSKAPKPTFAPSVRP